MQELAELAQSLTELKKHPSWKVLRELFEKRKTSYFDALAHKLAAGGITSPVIDQREIDYQRGFWAGAQWLLDNPEKANSSLESALRRAEIIKEK